MAFFLTPRFAPAYQQCGPFNCAPARQHHYSRASTPSFPSFLGQLDGLFSELERESRRASHQQRQQRKRTFRARFDVKETEDTYEVEGDIPGFEQENINIEVTDEHTLKISGDTEQRIVAEPKVTEPEAKTMEDVTPAEAEADYSDTASQTGSETGSHKSYQPTVEDDFEDLGVDSTPASPSESKGKEKAVEKVNNETAAQKQPQPEVLAKKQEPETKQWLSERVRGSFERTFEFPERIDMGGVKASLRNGVLSVSIPKAPAFQTKRIRIE